MFLYEKRLQYPIRIKNTNPRLAAASGTPFNANTFSVTGDTLADLHEDMGAEQKARMTYDNILRFTDDPDVRDPIKFLREREIVHFQRFGEANHTHLSKNDPL